MPTATQKHRQTGHALQRAWVCTKIKTKRLAHLGNNSRALKGARGFLARLMALLLTVSVLCGKSLYRAAAHVGTWTRAHVAPPFVRGGVWVYDKVSPVVRAMRRSLRELKHRERARLSPVLMMLTATVVIISASYFGVGLEVSLNGGSLGFVKDRGEVEALVAQVEDQIGAYLGTPYSINPQFSYTLSYTNAGNDMDTEAVSRMLLEGVEQMSSQYVLTVDGEVVAANTSKTALELMLNRVMQSQSYLEGQVKTNFVQEVRIEEAMVSDAQLKTITEIEQMLTANTKETQTYTVQSGDTVSAIAQRYDLAMREIETLNPAMQADKIGIGDEITVSASVPYLSLEQTLTEEYQEVIGYDTILEYDDDMYVNESRVRVAGITGLADVVADVVYVDGHESVRNVTSYTVLSEPSSEIKVVGTMELPPKAPTGSFIKPSGGVFTSDYGNRPSMGDFHTGVDFAGSTGTSIWAADGGVVTFAGWKGNYGNCVIVDHGNGYTTLYAHCNSLLVYVGQEVGQGEKIATVGSTGRSTGPHVHFEIQINNDHVDPLNYIWK